MAKARSRKDLNLRLHIAYLAARLMAEDGVSDYGAAKQKAARQAGLRDANLLPDNHEIEAALREYQGLYQKDDQPLQLRRMREVAVQVMREFEAFHPALVGSVLSGTAGRHSDVNLQLFPDDSKALSLFLLNKRYEFEEGARRIRRGEGFIEVPQFALEVDGIPVTLTVFDPDEERSSPRPRADVAPQRARLAEVEALLGTEP
ncbi:hypothetical protein [Usitatibacter palustris]|uniref:Nucleotidyltransferase domain-containing protein n=1 Tax=Usitatibacter palustris TaxID=2732487 RepID=A0A6M4H177_9PROT|nr:hypothetical protein [Usitatibacter palustris]QJR13246.1 hypothetical protein DSM104440_00028 [Usitatibacter palustris]